MHGPYFVVGEQGVPLNVVELALVRVGQPGRRRWQVLCSIQAQDLMQPRLHSVTSGVSAPQEDRHISQIN